MYEILTFVPYSLYNKVKKNPAISRADRRRNTMRFQKIGLIGCGNMGSALAATIQKEGRSIYLSNRTVSKAETLARSIGASVSTNLEIAGVCDLILLGVKPQMMPGLLGSFPTP